MNETKIKSAEWIQFGQHFLEAWYFTPIPKEFNSTCLYICDKCLHFFVHKKELIRHCQNCKWTHPPGDEIYRDGNVSIFEVDPIHNGTKRVYCENIGYISKIFLECKMIKSTVEGFIFYILCEQREDGFHFVGYFSKQRDREAGDYNLSCIVVMPFCQKAGYGKFLIEMSYELCTIEGKPGGPETPFSDLGLKTYISYWTRRVVTTLLSLEKAQKEISILGI